MNVDVLVGLVFECCFGLWFCCVDCFGLEFVVGYECGWWGGVVCFVLLGSIIV